MNERGVVCLDKKGRSLIERKGGRMNEMVRFFFWMKRRGV